jgi:hypothetical protein
MEQDIAVDGECPYQMPIVYFPISLAGWALTLLSEENLSYASTCQTIGLNTGFFSSFTLFLAFSSPEFA